MCFHVLELIAWVYMVDLIGFFFVIWLMSREGQIVIEYTRGATLNEQEEAKLNDLMLALNHE
jgi:hypothetical protein